MRCGGYRIPSHWSRAPDAGPREEQGSPLERGLVLELHPRRVHLGRQRRNVRLSPRVLEKSFFHLLEHLGFRHQLIPGLAHGFGGGDHGLLAMHHAESGGRLPGVGGRAHDKGGGRKLGGGRDPAHIADVRGSGHRLSPVEDGAISS